MSVVDFLAFQKRIFDEVLAPPECWLLLANAAGTEGNTVVALFDTRAQAETYLTVSTLPAHDTYYDSHSRRRWYRPDSVLWNFNPMLGTPIPVQQARTRDVFERGYGHLPVNPAPPSRPIAEIIAELRAGAVAEALA